MRPSLKVEAEAFCQRCPVRDSLRQGPVSVSLPFPERSHGQTVSSPASVEGPLRDWIESQVNVLGIWLDRLIEEGDPGDLISMVHRQQSWLELMGMQLERR